MREKTKTKHNKKNRKIIIQICRILKNYKSETDTVKKSQTERIIQIVIMRKYLETKIASITNLIQEMEESQRLKIQLSNRPIDQRKLLI